MTPDEAGLDRVEPGALRGGNADDNAKALQAVLDGTPGAFRDVALLNAAATLVVAGKAANLKDGVLIGRKSLDGGAAAKKLDHLIAVSNA